MTKSHVPIVLLREKVGRVVIGMLDPNPLISGVGWKKLRQANIKVTVISDSDLLAQLEELKPRVHSRHRIR